nr:uncharacterized protein LOC129427303 isoform X4 [Misgurnus anguillicaudatus]
MATKRRQSRRCLAGALDRAAEESPGHRTSTLLTVSQDDTNEDVHCSRLSTILQDMCEFLDKQILENLVAKLEFENELNRVCSRSTQIQNPDSSSGPGNNRECKYGVVEEESTDHLVHESRDDFSFLLDTILEIERDYDVTADCDVSCMEHVLQLSP